MPRLPWRSAFALAACLPLTAAAARLVVSASAPRFPEVTLAVHATTRDGGPVTDLAAADFKVLEDLAPAQVLAVQQLRTHSMRPIDIVFVFDSTGSMSEEIEALVRRAKTFCDLLVQSNLDYRLTLLPFGDVLGEPSKPTSDVRAFKQTLSKLRAVGGGDEPENQLAALVLASGLPSREGARRVFVLITDATFHTADAVTPLKPQEVVDTLRGAGVELHVVGPDIDPYRWMPAQLNGSFFDKDSGAFEELVSTLGGELAANYVVTYRSPRPQADGTRRSVTLVATQKSGSGEDASQYVAPALVEASSRLQQLQGDASQFSPHFAIDDDPNTAWVAGSSREEWLTLSFAQPRKLSRLTVRPSADPTFAVPRTLKVQLGDDPPRTLALDGTRNVQVLRLEPPAVVSRVRVEVAAAEPIGAPVAIAELSAGDGDSEAPELQQLRRTAADAAEAQRLNLSGEAAYHSGKLEASVKLYLAAVDRSPTLAQAWSNLGLSYWKLKRYADSVSANRQAIMLGRRQSQVQVVANSYYSMGRTFEEQHELKQALQSFWWANQAVPKPTYQAAVDRLTRKLAEDTP
jgi:tetratricopeptide (TPR) repeat protein